MFQRLCLAAALLAPAPLTAANLIANGGFEAGLTGWTLGGASDKYLPVAIQYGAAKAYPIGAFGEAVAPDNAASRSPDAAGAYGLYFVSDWATAQSLSQSVWLAPGRYDIGFSTYAPGNGYANKVDAQFSASIAGIQLARFLVSSGPAQTWQSWSGTADIAKPGDYLAQFVFDTRGAPAKDIVVDRVFIMPSSRGPAPGADGMVGEVPEPGTWLLLILGFGMVGAAVRRKRRTPVVAA